MAFEVNYSALDRLLHRVAFASPAVQRSLADVETSAFGKAYGGYAAAKPVFITSLPRAGTTLILELLAGLPVFATHTYRDMPFVLAPYLWSRLRRPFGRTADARERAHGDGIAIDFDSPEAFEEIFWRSFWPDKYGERQIALWNDTDDNREARAFFREHMQKIVALRRPERQADGRYISKNNANIARLALLRSTLPDATVLIPYREPLQHAASLLRQQKNFVEMQAQDSFVRRYMDDIGHLEFGDLHRPIAFPGVHELVAGSHPDQLAYWLGYWVAAFEHVLAHRDSVQLVGYESFCGSGESGLRRLCEQLGVEPGSELASAAARLRAPSRHDPDCEGVPRELLDRASALHETLVNSER